MSTWFLDIVYAEILMVCKFHRFRGYLRTDTVKVKSMKICRLHDTCYFFAKMKLTAVSVAITLIKMYGCPLLDKL